jgi:hypothetical protein
MVKSESEDGDNSSDNGFENFWKAYPRRVNKVEAKRRWDARLKQGENIDTLMLAVTNFRIVMEAQKRDSSKILHPATFLGPCKEGGARPYADYLDSAFVASETGGVFVSSQTDIQKQEEEIETIFGGDVRAWAKWAESGRPKL